MTRLRLDEVSLREPLRRELAKRPREVAAKGRGRASAVLIPIFERAGEAHVWLAVRAHGLRSHSGQVAFPGGKHEANDDSLLTTALREAEEEVALGRGDVDVLGALDDLSTMTTGYVITPFVGWVRDDLLLTPSEAEVARVFATPMRTFLGETTGIFPRIGWRVDGELVWGATARILRDLLSLIRGLSSVT